MIRSINLLIMEERTKTVLLWIGLPFAATLTVLLAKILIILIWGLVDGFFKDGFFKDGFFDGYISSIISGFLGVIVAECIAPKAKRLVGIIAGIVLSALLFMFFLFTGEAMPMSIGTIYTASAFQALGPVLGVVFVCRSN